MKLELRLIINKYMYILVLYTFLKNASFFVCLFWPDIFGGFLAWYWAKRIPNTWIPHIFVLSICWLSGHLVVLYLVIHNAAWPFMHPIFMWTYVIFRYMPKNDIARSRWVLSFWEISRFFPVTLSFTFHQYTKILISLYLQYFLLYIFV